MQNYIFWKHPKSAKIFIVIPNASILKWSRSVLRFMRISSVSQDISISLFNSSVAVGVCTLYKRRSLFQSGQKVRPGNRGQEAIDPDWAFVLAGLHYCALLSRITLSSLGINFKETHTGKCVGTREAVNGDTNIFLSKRTLKYHWRLVHFKCLHCCRALLRPCLISSPHF